MPDNRKRNREPDEPRVIIKPDEERRDARCINDFHGDKKPRKIRQHRDENDKITGTYFYRREKGRPPEEPSRSECERQVVRR